MSRVAEDAKRPVAILSLRESADSHGRFTLEGELDFNTVPALYGDSIAQFRPFRRISVDLGGVTRANSAGLALLLEWMEQGLRDDRELLLQRIPDRLMNIARASELQDLLPVDGGARPSGPAPGG